jgi:hypothetical protein
MADERTGSVYALCTPVGTPFYVGATVQSVGVRAGEHLREAFRRMRPDPLHCAMRDVGQQRVAFWEIERGIPIAKLPERERHWRRFNEDAGFMLLNSYGGGNGVHVQRPEQREKARQLALLKPRGEAGRFLAA